MRLLLWLHWWRCSPRSHPRGPAGEFTAASLAWLEKKGKTKLATLVKQLVSSRPAELTIDRRQAGAFGIAEFEATPAPAPEPAYVLL